MNLNINSTILSVYWLTTLTPKVSIDLGFIFTTHTKFRDKYLSICVQVASFNITFLSLFNK